jgi:hypothetical protein
MNVATSSVNGEVVFCRRLSTREAFPLSSQLTTSDNRSHLCSSLVIMLVIFFSTLVWGGFSRMGSRRTILSANPSSWLLRCPHSLRRAPMWLFSSLFLGFTIGGTIVGVWNCSGLRWGSSELWAACNATFCAVRFSTLFYIWASRSFRVAIVTSRLAGLVGLGTNPSSWIFDHVVTIADLFCVEKDETVPTDSAKLLVQFPVW